MNNNEHMTELEQDDAPRHDMAGNVARNYINSPITPLFLIGFFLIGIFGVIFTPRQEDPQISVPMADIFIQYPGATAKQVEALVSEPLERLLKEINGVEHVYSASMRGQSLITVQYVVGENTEKALVNLYNKLSSNADIVPPGVKQPLIKPKGADDVPMITFTLSSDTLDSSQLRLLGLDTLQSLGEIDGANQGYVIGGEPREIKIQVSPEKLAGYGISLTQIGQTIHAANSELETGKIEAWQQSFKVYTGDFLKSEEDIKNLIVGIKDHAPVYVRDIATVTSNSQDPTKLVNFYTGKGYSGQNASLDGRNAVTIALAKKPGTNGVSVAEDAIARIEGLKGILIPPDVDVSISRNYGQSANDKVNNLIFKLFVATGAVTILVWLFLGWRAGVVVAIVIPSVILSTVFMAWVLDFTIDRVSLFALIFSIGILVDDAVVVLENIYRRWLLSNKSDTATSVAAVAEVGNPTIIATFAVIAALMPMAFVSGMMGPYMAPIPALGSVAMIISLFAAFAFTPWLAMRIKPSMETLEKAEKKEHEQGEKMEAFFRKLLGSLLIGKAKGWGFLIGIIAAFAVAIFLLYESLVPVKLLPFDNKPDMSVVINFPEGTSLPVTANLTHDLVKELQKIDEISTMETYVGTAAPYDFNGLVRHYYLRQNPWESDIQIHLVDKKHRHRSSHEIAEAMRSDLVNVVGESSAKIQIVEMPPGPPVLQAVVAEVYGPNEASRKATTKALTDVFENAKNVTDVDNLLTAAHNSWRFVIDKQKAIESGISVTTINKTLEMAMGGYRLGDAKQGFMREPTFITLEVPLEMRAEFARMGAIPVATAKGSTVPLSELGTFVLENEQSMIYHKDLRAVEYVTATGVGRLGAPIYGMLEIQDILDNTEGLKGLEGNFVSRPDGLTENGFMWAGEWTVTYETFRDMGLAFGVALIIIYMLVVWEFKNFIIPLIVMAPIPLTLIGIAPGHWLMGAEFTATSMIGFIALAGIIVRNSILLVDFSRQEIKNGVPITEAVIQACKARTRPIMITAVALILGSSVILFDPIFQGMAISLMFGVMVATLLTLVVIPLGCVSARAAFCPGGTDSYGDPIPGCEMPDDVKPESETSTVRKTVTSIKTVIDPYFSIQRKIQLDENFKPVTKEPVAAEDKEAIDSNAQEKPVDIPQTNSDSTSTESTEIKTETSEQNKDVQPTDNPPDSSVNENEADPDKAIEKPKPARKTTTRKTSTTTTKAKTTRTRKKPAPAKSTTKATTTTKKPVTRRKRGIQLKDDNDE
ncbi:efflux RND transporter permease subunit [Thiomicrorhabdus sp. Milos-T2]|uniref:efflux RND transporter permease subunit n=1 Tax=Thiomicrorhabdus sp. Milos-T2 TaxID=90814 RepID=UPI000A01554C|nr:efflux RND transporter permease subunit [Thiomicrorhabdus sp. Milos-T2]